MTGFFVPRASYATPWSGHVVVVAPDDLPTTHYYLEARLAALPPGAVRRANALAPESAEQIAELPGGSFVVIVRHASAAVLEALLARRASLAGVAFLVDDDLPNAWRCRDLPRAYAVRTSWRYWQRSGLLGRVCDRLWVSTPALAERCPPGSRERVRILPPCWHGAAPQPAAAGNRQWFYHATASHRSEAEWLRPVVAQVQARCQEAVFEIVGGDTIERAFRGIPRVRVVAQRPWSTYHRHCAERRMAVGVAPLLDRPFNRYRAPVKVFDIARLGAVGVFSDAPAYRGAVRDGETGYLLGMNVADWVESIDALLRDDERRARMFAAAWENCAAAPGVALSREILGRDGERYDFGRMAKAAVLR